MPPPRRNHPKGWPIIGATLRDHLPSHDTSRPLRQGAAPAPARGLSAWLEARLPAAWLHRGPLACALWPLSLVYRALAGLHRALYQAGLKRPERLPVPVVVVGNVVAGGAGKTPAVIAVVQHLKSRGWNPGIVSRGHGRRATACLEVHANSPASETGDEPLLLRRRCGVPVFVAARRVEAGRALLATHPGVDILVADDGMQHLALERDVQVVVFDDRGLGNGWLLPAGPLRQAWPEAVQRTPATLVLRTSPACPLKEGYASNRQLAAHGVSASGEHIALSSLPPGRVMAVAGIARPQRFFDMLRERGVQLRQALALPDHDDLTGLKLDWADGLTVLCTEKDAVKLFDLHPEAGRQLLAVPLSFSPEPAFLAALDEALATRHPLRLAHGHTTT